MGVSFGCTCEERQKPVSDRNWVVTLYKWNNGAFTVAGGEYSDYSAIVCLSCGASGRSKAKYVDKLDHMSWQEAYRISLQNSGRIITRR